MFNTSVEQVQQKKRVLQDTMDIITCLQKQVCMLENEIEELERHVTTSNDKQYDTKVVIGFPGVGKTYIYNNQKQLGLVAVDSDSSQFSWLKDDKGNNTDKRNPYFVVDYVQHIQSLMGKVDYIFVSSHPEVRNALHLLGISYVVVYPSINIKDEWLKRLELRGSSPAFISMINNNWEEFILPLMKPDRYNSIALQSGQHLLDVLQQI